MTQNVALLLAPQQRSYNYKEPMVDMLMFPPPYLTISSVFFYHLILHSLTGMSGRILR